MNWNDFLKWSTKVIEQNEVDFHIDLEGNITEFSCPFCEKYINFEILENEKWTEHKCPYCNEEL